MDWDPGAIAPIYQQVAGVIKRRIESGALPPGRRIPSEKELVEEFGIARETARRAVAWLRDEGLVRTLPQRGSYVVQSGSESVIDTWSTNDSAPAYQRIATRLKERIEAGRLRPGGPIPSEKKIVEEFEVSRVTARRAIAYLREQGLIYTVPQRGSYVSPRD
ncbi:hypothetical protein GCM10010191_82060 [Actinomadura vinacea]|uniref:HTH gntR-type domain-containing protein n=1 Tax=Actinomadura vinacea TaxID=115336 RepID=A0ABN3KB07_9ACTN